MRGIDRRKNLGAASVCVLFLVAMACQPLFAQEPARTGAYRSAPLGSDGEASPGGVITEGEQLTLARCMDIALAQNPAITASASLVEAGKSRIGEARSVWYPQLRAQAGYNRVDPAQSRATGAVPGAFDQYTGSVTLTQNILDFGRTSSQVGISKYNLASSHADLSAVRDTIVLGVKQAYYGVLKAGRNRDVAADALKQFQLHLDQAKGFYEVGTRAKIDVIKAEVDLSNARLGLIKAENALKIAWVTLNNVMGVPDAPAYTIEDNLSFQPYAITLEEAIGRAFEHKPELKAFIARRRAAEENVGLAGSGHYPLLSGSAGYTWVGEGAISPLESGWSAGVVLSVPLFSGFLTSHQVAEARSNLYAVKASEESLRQQVLLEVRQAYLNLQEAGESIVTAELAASQARENMDLANGRYAAGVGSPIEVSDAFATYVAAQANYNGALADYKIAQASIERAMGGSGK